MRLSVFFSLVLFFAVGSAHAQQGQQVIVEEHFNDNGYGWQELKAGNISFDVASGNYMVSNKSQRDIIAYKSVYINESADFHIKCTLKQVKGPKKGRFGLVWGMNDFDNFFAFSLSPAQVFNVYTSEEREIFNIKNWTFNEAIKTEGEYNTIEIKKEDKDLYFSINGKQVYYRAADPFFGGKIGFIASPGVTVAVDDLVITNNKQQVNLDPAVVYATPREQLNKTVNSQYKDTRPILSSNGNTLYFVRENHPQNTGVRGRMDVWLSRMAENGEWEEARRMEENINDEHDNFIGGIVGQDEHVLIGKNEFSNRAFDLNLALAQQTDAGWTLPKSLQIEDFYANSPEASYYIAPLGDVLLMTIDRDDSYGGRDIYVSFKQESGKWSAPKNLGPEVNTSADEVSAFITPDGQTLYYATQGKPGYGNTDIFVSNRVDNTWNNWTEPRNLGPQVNTTGAESSFFIPENSEFAYFDSNNGTNGSSDIFRIKLPLTREMPDTDVMAAKETTAPAFVKVSGNVLDPVNRQPVAATVAYRNSQTGETVATATADKDGNFTVSLPAGQKYEAVVKNAGHFFSIAANINLNEQRKSGSAAHELYLLPAAKGNILRMEHLLFDLNQASLSEKGMIDLGKLAIFLSRFPSVQLEIVGHTDDTGTAAINQELSLKRAEAVARYLQGVGIEASRMVVKGYGMEYPLAPNTTEINRAINRRVEFKISQE